MKIHTQTSRPARRSDAKGELAPAAPLSPGAARTAFRLRHILVPFDFSDCAKLALGQAIGYARCLGARLTLLHVVHLPLRGVGFGPGVYPGMEGRLCADMGKHLSALAEEITRQGVPAAALTQIGHPGLEVVEIARQQSSDLIIMGTHGRTGLKHVLLGSTAERVLRHAPCPVLVVREREHDVVNG